jgi:hypothetical protein
MSAYDNDDRVYLKPSGSYWIELPGTAGWAGSQDGYVTPLPNGKFEAYLGVEGAEARQFDTADDAIRSLIGDPQ